MSLAVYWVSGEETTVEQLAKDSFETTDAAYQWAIREPRPAGVFGFIVRTEFEE